MHCDEFLDHRGDLFAPAAAVEDAVMARALGHQIALLRRVEIGRQFQRGAGLAQAGNIVALAIKDSLRSMADCS